MPQPIKQPSVAAPSTMRQYPQIAHEIFSNTHSPHTIEYTAVHPRAVVWASALGVTTARLWAPHRPSGAALGTQSQQITM